ncbi:hypothetical protein MTYM_00924 [Methylococcales bacterium]|nr:hypothetical protein MTYM_00924 [Methylococcales bacterium]
MSYVYVIAPVVGYLSAGGLKFAINSLKARNLAVSEIGLGGFPSTHTTVVSSILFLIGLREGLSSPLLGIAIALNLVVIIDAMDLRRKVGRHAHVINRLARLQQPDVSSPALRERMGHSPLEVLGGFLTGLTVALILDRIDRSLF